jgi:hypothetical protein
VRFVRALGALALVLVALWVLAFLVVIIGFASSAKIAVGGGVVTVCLILGAVALTCLGFAVALVWPRDKLSHLHSESN